MVLKPRPRAYQTDEGSGGYRETGKGNAGIEDAASDSRREGSVHGHQHRLGEAGEKTRRDEQTPLSREGTQRRMTEDAPLHNYERPRFNGGLHFERGQQMGKLSIIRLWPRAGGDLVLTTFLGEM